MNYERKLLESLKIENSRYSELTRQYEQEIDILSHEVQLLESESARSKAETVEIKRKLAKLDKIVYGHHRGSTKSLNRSRC